jgi:hypothetical protein
MTSTIGMNMTWIRVITAEEATDDLARAYERAGVDTGPISLPYSGLTHNGPALLKLMEFTSQARFGPSSLTRLQQELTATYVSVLNHCVF